MCTFVVMPKAWLVMFTEPSTPLCKNRFVSCENYLKEKLKLHFSFCGDHFVCLGATVFTPFFVVVVREDFIKLTTLPSFALSILCPLVFLSLLFGLIMMDHLLETPTYFWVRGQVRAGVGIKTVVIR